MNNAETYSVRPPNWLPLPGVADRAEVIAEPQLVDEHDNFPKATVEEYYPRLRMGFLITDGGKRIKFDLSRIRLAGPAHPHLRLKKGCRVGFDVGRTSNGVRLSTLKVYC